MMRVGDTVNFPEYDWLGVLTGKISLEDEYMKIFDREITKMKTHLIVTFLNSAYIGGISEVLIAKGIMTKEEDKLLMKKALEEAEKLVEEQIKEAREIAKAEFSKALNQKEN